MLNLTVSNMKIIVAGPFQCGKSTYVESLDNNALNIMTIDKSGNKCTIAMDIGSIDYKGLKINIFGTPGLLRFTTIRQIVSEGADGIIFMFDGVNSEKDDASLQILNEIRRLLPKNTPIIYVVNKIDSDDCRAIDVVRKQNYLPKSSEIIGISALKGENIRDPINKISVMIKDNLAPLIRILQKYEKNPLGLRFELDKTAERVMELLNAMELRQIISIDRQNMTFSVQEKAKFFIT
ncbi:MAG: GTP-binding protein [Promethearchaeota archaeon]